MHKWTATMLYLPSKQPSPLARLIGNGHPVLQSSSFNRSDCTEKTSLNEKTSQLYWNIWKLKLEIVSGDTNSPKGSMETFTLHMLHAKPKSTSRQNLCSLWLWGYLSIGSKQYGCLQGQVFTMGEKKKCTKGGGGAHKQSLYGCFPPQSQTTLYLSQSRVAHKTFGTISYCNTVTSNQSPNQ